MPDVPRTAAGHATENASYCAHLRSHIFLVSTGKMCPSAFQRRQLASWATISCLPVAWPAGSAGFAARLAGFGVSVSLPQRFWPSVKSSLARLRVTSLICVTLHVCRPHRSARTLTTARISTPLLMLICYRSILDQRGSAAPLCFCRSHFHPQIRQKSRTEPLPVLSCALTGVCRLGERPCSLPRFGERLFPRPSAWLWPSCAP
jgi:hypothetical protein